MTRGECGRAIAPRFTSAVCILPQHHDGICSAVPQRGGYVTQDGTDLPPLRQLPPVPDGWTRPPWRDTYAGGRFRELDGTTGALAQALTDVPANATLSLGGDPIDTDGKNIWYWPEKNEVTVM